GRAPLPGRLPPGLRGRRARRRGVLPSAGSGGSSTALPRLGYLAARPARPARRVRRSRSLGRGRADLVAGRAPLPRRRPGAVREGPSDLRRALELVVVRALLRRDAGARRLPALEPGAGGVR